LCRSALLNGRGSPSPRSPPRLTPRPIRETNNTIQPNALSYRPALFEPTGSPTHEQSTDTANTNERAATPTLVHTPHAKRQRAAAAQPPTARTLFGNDRALRQSHIGGKTNDTPAPHHSAKTGAGAPRGPALTGAPGPFHFSAQPSPVPQRHTTSLHAAAPGYQQRPSHDDCTVFEGHLLFLWPHTPHLSHLPLNAPAPFGFST
jgi:hypothetical protein